MSFKGFCWFKNNLSDDVLQAFLETSPIALYDANNTIGTTAIDLSSNNYDAQIIGVSIVNDTTSPIGKSFLFDGINDFLNIASDVYNVGLHNSISFQSYSILVLAKKRQVDTISQAMYSFGNTSNSLARGRVISNSFLINFALSGPGSSATHSGIDPTQWALYGQTSFDTNGRAYFNGDKVKDQSKPNNLLHSPFITAGNQYYDGTYSDYWDGWIALVAIWDYQITTENIRAIYEALGI